MKETLQTKLSLTWPERHLESSHIATARCKPSILLQLPHRPRTRCNPLCFSVVSLQPTCWIVSPFKIKEKNDLYRWNPHIAEGKQKVDLEIWAAMLPQLDVHSSSVKESTSVMRHDWIRFPRVTRSWSKSKWDLVTRSLSTSLVKKCCRNFLYQKYCKDIISWIKGEQPLRMCAHRHCVVFIQAGTRDKGMEGLGSKELEYCWPRLL
jgi:hypothetical protein